jgi:hypothetical protein
MLWVIGEVFVFIVVEHKCHPAYFSCNHVWFVGAIQIRNVVLKVLLPPRALILPAIQLVLL